MRKRFGKQSVKFENRPVVASTSSIVGDIEGAGPLGNYFDIILEDDMWGEESYEKAERKMYEMCVKNAIERLNITNAGIDCLLGGDLLNQLISANYAARQLKIPFLGLYGACSTITESVLIGSMLIDGGFGANIACAASSHFSTAERQYRMPLELGQLATPTSQRTVTGAGCIILSDGCRPDAKKAYSGCSVVVSCGTIGRVIDLGITDANNMGAAMAPAAADTIVTHLNDFNKTVDDYDIIVTGDLGTFGTEMLRDVCQEKGVDLKKKHFDCGAAMFAPEQNTVCGASGCGCAATVVSSYIIGKMISGEIKKALVMATGALMSPIANLQGESIPSIAHAIVLERE